MSFIPIEFVIVESTSSRGGFVSAVSDVFAEGELMSVQPAMVKASPTEIAHAKGREFGILHVQLEICRVPRPRPAVNPRYRTWTESFSAQF